MIKEVIAIIRPGKWADTLHKLEEVGVVGFTRNRVYGRGKQKGLRYNSEPENEGISFLPKWMVMIVVEDSKVDAVVQIISAANRTGEIGDGKIFICNVSNVIRVRTNENQDMALR